MQQIKEYEIVYLLTSVNDHYQRVSMHGVRVELLQKQAMSLGIPLIQLRLPETIDMNMYETKMAKTLLPLREQGIGVSIFGDIFLEDLRKYREEKLAALDFIAVFPLWQCSTKQLVREFIAIGFKAIVVSVNERYLGKSFAGRTLDAGFLKDLPANVDPCGEYGEFHTFVYDGPIFNHPVKFEKGEVVYRRYSSQGPQQPPQSLCQTDDNSDVRQYGYWYCDLLPV